MAEFGFKNEFSENQSQPPPLTAPSMVSEEMECPHSKVGVVIGAKGVIIQEIMRRSNCKVVVYQDGLPDGQPRNVVITGAPGQVAIAKQLINAVIQEGPTVLQTQAPGVNANEPTVTEEMSCPPEKVGLVIGSKGVIIQEIMRRSYCKITVNQNFPDGEPRIINITGKAPQIEIAKELLNLVIANGPSALNQCGLGVHSASNITEEMDCPQEKVGIVIGAKGVIVQEIMRRCGCKITINQDFPDGQPRRVVFTGTPQQVESGKNLVNAVITHGPSAVQGIGGRGDSVQDLNIVQSQVGKLIGPGGSTIKDIQQRFNVKMNVDQLSPDTDERRLRITGDGAAVHAATQVVFSILNDGGNPNMQGAPQQGYGVPMVGSYGNDGSHMMHGYGMHQSGYGNAEGMQQMGPVGQGLGADGSSGRLMPPSTLPNGMVIQIVYILKNLVGQIAGKDFATLALIMSKSAAQVQIEQGTVMASGGQEMCKINVVGAPANVSLAGQMIQEVLINGPDKLNALPDPVYNNADDSQQRNVPHQQYSNQQYSQGGNANSGSGEYMNMPQQGYHQQGQYYGNANGSQSPYNSNPYYQQQGQGHQQK